jgi:hypothetical protein
MNAAPAPDLLARNYEGTEATGENLSLLLSTFLLARLGRCIPRHVSLSQAALVVGAANAGTVNASARPRVMISALIGHVPYCNRPLIKIDHYGEMLVGCIHCNRWGHPGDEHLIMETY